MNSQNSTLNNKTKTSKTKTVSLSVPKGYEKEVAYVNEQPNKSRYIWDLVREDMKKQSEDNQILEIVRQAMQNINMETNVNNSIPSKKVNNSNELKRKKGAMAILQD